jgi:hypothetical protein
MITSTPPGTASGTRCVLFPGLASVLLTAGPTAPPRHRPQALMGL